VINPRVVLASLQSSVVDPKRLDSSHESDHLLKRLQGSSFRRLRAPRRLATGPSVLWVSLSVARRQIWYRLLR
jgi:hypothetical protein